MNFRALTTVATLLSALAVGNAQLIPTKPALSTATHPRKFARGLNTSTKPTVVLSDPTRATLATAKGPNNNSYIVPTSEPSTGSSTIHKAFSPEPQTPSGGKSYWFLLYFLIPIMWISVIFTWFGLCFEIRRWRNERTPLLGGGEYRRAQTREL